METRTISRFRDLVSATEPERRITRALVAAGHWRDAEPLVDRSKDFAARRAGKRMGGGREALQGDTVDYQNVSFLVEGAVVQRAVGYVECTLGTISSIGTGFLISPRLFLTNQHVIPNAAAALGALVTFDRQLDERGRPRATTSFTLDPQAFALFSDESELDFALLAVGPKQGGAASLRELGFCALSDAPDKHVIGMPTNIVQHPNGLRKVVSLRNNLLVARTDRTLLYETDTETGSSGSPVFNDDWDVVALHHYGEPSREKVDDTGQPLPAFVNEGIRVSAICRELQSRLPSLGPAARALLEEALALGRGAVDETAGPMLGPPRRARGPTTESAPQALEHNQQQEIGMPDAPDHQTLEIVVPLRITVSAGTPSPATPSTAAQPLGITAALLGRKAEAVHVDIDYSNRGGYDENFIPGIEVPLPLLTGATQSALAPLRATEAHSASGELKYQHFSVKLNRSKQMAVYTATNIDGETYLRVDRGTGRAVMDAAEGERWFEDPRISASFTLTQAFYSQWSTYFDRGHLTRRTDPTWGDAASAERANADTFHFTNCSPQHFRFNQTAKFWQGIERYVLETGVRLDGQKGRLCVFQGPLFDDAIDRMAGDVQIPSSFFKVVCWNGAAGLKAVGMVADQGPLLDEPRRALGAPREIAHVDVNHWRVGIGAIEARAGLDFGQAVRAADTILVGEQPVVGRESLQGRLITRFEHLGVEFA